jgi:hypothetical protein
MLTLETMHECGDHRANFLHGHQSHFLCHWHLCDTQAILGKALATVDGEVAARSAKPAAITSKPAPKRKKSKDDSDDMKKLRVEFGNAMGSIACDAAIESVVNEEKNL